MPRLTTEQEAHLYTIDPIVAENTKAIRLLLNPTYEKALQLMEEYGARIMIETDILSGDGDGQQMALWGK